MSNFKSGSGNLDFGDRDEDTNENKVEEEESSSEESTSSSGSQQTSQTPDSSEQSVPAQDSSNESTTSSSPNEEYPYFVRRNNVGDERDTRLEIHLRDEVANQEAKFLSELAEQLETNEIAKTDAREFALLTAFQHPERVAELMQEEGFGTFG